MGVYKGYKQTAAHIANRTKRYEDLTGRIFSRLTVVALAADRQNGHRQWECRCECGKEHLALGIHLVSGAIRSCGCYNREQIITRNTTHGHSFSGQWTPEYGTWLRMKARCHNPANSHYRHYGARGITVCTEWRDDYSAFFAHVGPRPSANHSIDRIDNNRGYHPGNVRWATTATQSLNRRDTGRFLTLDDQPISIGAIAHHLALTRSQFTWAMRRAGFSI